MLGVPPGIFYRVVQLLFDVLGVAFFVSLGFHALERLGQLGVLGH